MSGMTMLGGDTTDCARARSAPVYGSSVDGLVWDSRRPGLSACEAVAAVAHPCMVPSAEPSLNGVR